MHTLTPGKWYLLYTCRRCNVKQILFPDLSCGTATINCEYVVACQECDHRDSYDQTAIERYYHPVTRYDGEGDAGRGVRRSDRPVL